MKKISTLFKKDPTNLGRVINEVNPENVWVFTDGIPTRKFDGTSCAIINGEIYKRYDVKWGRSVPEGAIPCQEPDEVSGHWPHWLRCERKNKADKWHLQAFDAAESLPDGTYELCGEKVGVNAEKIAGHTLIRHGSEVLEISDFTFEFIKSYLSDPANDIEGIVFHHKEDDRMCKIRKSDFGIKR